MFIDQRLMSEFEFLGHKKLLDQVVCISEYGLIDNGKLHSQAIQNILQVIDTGRLPVLNFSGNPIKISNYLKSINRSLPTNKFFILHSDCRPIYDSSPNIDLWPTELLAQQMSGTVYTPNFIKNYRISCLMRQPRLHRLMLLQNIRPWVNPSDVVVANAPPEDCCLPKNVADNVQLCEQIKELPWSNHARFIDIDQQPRRDFIPYKTNHPAYHARVNITNETWADDDLLFITEKTWKAYSTGCLVVNFGSAEVPNQLKRWGLEIWEEYDQPLHYEQKIKSITELFQRTDIDELYEKNTDLIAHNQSLVSSWFFAKKISSPTIEKIKCLI